MKLLLFALLISCVFAELPPVRGTATIQVDLSCLSADVSVSLCESNVFFQQGGAVRTYTLNTVNAFADCRVVITEGGVASWNTTVKVINDAKIVIDNHLADLWLRIENYNPFSVGNTFTIRLRNNENTFREYAPTGPFQANIVAVSSLGPFPRNTSAKVCVLRTNCVTVWIAENRLPVPDPATPAVFVVGHDDGWKYTRVCNCGVGVTTSGRPTCDSGRLIAKLQAPFQCYPPYDFGFKAVTASLIWNPRPVNQPQQLVRRWNNLQPAIYDWYVIASDNYLVAAAYPDASSNGTVHHAASNCFSGNCESLPIVSVLEVDSCFYNTSITVSQNGTIFGTYLVTPQKNKICVFNEVNQHLSVRFPGAGNVAVEIQGINCETTTPQICHASACAKLTPDWGCLGYDYPMAIDTDLKVGVRITSPEGAVVYSRWGRPAAIIDVPAISGLILEVQDGKCPLTPALPPSTLNACARASFFVTDCSISAPQNHQTFPIFGSCTTDRIGRVLSMFDLNYLPETTDVELVLPQCNGTFRRANNVGEEPRCFCVLPVVLQASIHDNGACWKSVDTSCVEAVEGPYDCSLCDFLSILQFDLTGLPRDVSARLEVGPQYGQQVVLVNESFSLFYNQSTCFATYAGSRLSPQWFTNFPKNNNIVIMNGVGAPQSRSNDERVILQNPSCPLATKVPDALYGSTSMQIGAMVNRTWYNSSCVDFVVPEGAIVINVEFDAWQQGNGDKQAAQIRTVGSSTGANLQAWISVTPDQWTRNSFQLLNAAAGETIQLCFVVFANGTNDMVGTQIDNVLVVSQSYTLQTFRDLSWVGNRMNNVPVLRSAAGAGCVGCPGTYQRYCITVFDGPASKRECTICNDKTCQPENPFVCYMCLDLSSPQDIPGIEGSLNVRIEFRPPGGQSDTVRDIPFQGGLNGCSSKKRDAMDAARAYRKIEAQVEKEFGLTPATMAKMSTKQITEAMKLVDEAMQSKKKRGLIPDAGQSQSVYAVLCNNYEVCVREYSHGPLCFPVDCSPVFGNCSYTEIIALATIDLACPGNPSGGLLPSTLSATLYDTFTTFSPVNGAVVTGAQFRGERSSTLQDPKTCIWSPETWSSPSYANQPSRGSLVQFPVLRLPFILRLDEHTAAWNGTWPDLIQHPYRAHEIDCTGTAFCYGNAGDFLATFWVESERGLPDNSQFILKFGSNSQNPIRYISSTGASLNAPDWNRFCVLSDRRPWYVAQWGTWSSEGAGLPYASCATSGPTIDACPTSITVPPVSK